MVNTSLVILTSNVAQAVGAAVLAMVLLGFHRYYQRPYLLKWAWSWGAFCVALVAQSIALVLVQTMPAGAPARLAGVTGRTPQALSFVHDQQVDAGRDRLSGQVRPGD